MVQESADDAALRIAANNGDNVQLTEIIQRGKANINSLNKYDNTALHLAIFQSHAPAIRTLLDHGAYTGIPNINGQTPLQLACVKGNMEIVQMLTDAMESDFNAKTEYSGMTALHFASKEGNAQICQHLLDMGAEEQIADMVGKFAEFYAKNEPTEKVFQKWRYLHGGVIAESKKDEMETDGKNKEAEEEEEGKNEWKNEEEEASDRETGKDTRRDSKTEDKFVASMLAQDAAEKSRTDTESDDATRDAPRLQDITEDATAHRRKEPHPYREDDDDRHPRDDRQNEEQEDAEYYDRWRQENANPSNAPLPPGEDMSAAAAKKTKKKRRKGEELKHQDRRHKWEYKSRRGHVDPLRDHEFEWSKEFKARQRTSVFSRLTNPKK